MSRCAPGRARRAAASPAHADCPHPPAQVGDGMLFDLILAANYMDIKSLLDLACKRVAAEIKDKTPDEIRSRFGIENDLTPEEEEQVKRENTWCEER